MNDVKIDVANKNTNIIGVKKIIKECFPLYWKPTEACLATVATLLLKNNANPTSLILIGQASTGKTTVLDFFKGIDDITYLSDHFTPKAFVSHYADRNKDSLKDIDLLKRIIQKCLIVPDLGVIFGKRREDLAENLSILTRALDGDGLATDSGVHGHRELIGDCMFAMLCATTPFGYKIWEEMGRFGSRMLFLHMPNTKKSNTEIIKDFKTDLTYRDRRKICQDVIKGFLQELWAEKDGFRSVDWKDDEMPEDALEIISNLADLLTKLRGMIQSIWEDKEGKKQRRQEVVVTYLNILRVKGDKIEAEEHLGREEQRAAAASARAEALVDVIANAAGPMKRGRKAMAVAV